jgi:hypothetical protein
MSEAELGIIDKAIEKRSIGDATFDQTLPLFMVCHDRDGTPKFVNDLIFAPLSHLDCVALTLCPGFSDLQSGFGFPASMQNHGSLRLVTFKAA